MGVKRRIIKKSETYTKNGILYVKSGKQGYRVCDCHSQYRHCLRCNPNNGSLPSHYIGTMFNHARQRSREKNYDLCEKVFYKLLSQSIVDSKMECQCEKCTHQITRLRMSVIGCDKLSIVRSDNTIGYTHENQNLLLYAKSHCSYQSRQETPILKMKPRLWMNVVVAGMVTRSSIRVTSISEQIKELRDGGWDTSHLNLRRESHMKNVDKWKSLIVEQREKTPLCSKCDDTLDYGDSTGKLYYKNNHLQASVDRIDDMFGYIRGNVRIVCTACQSPSTPGEVDNIFIDDVGYINLIEYLHKKQ